MTLLREIQGAATDGSTPIGTLLRKAKILAARLQNPEFAEWVHRELNGYADEDPLPPYRVVGVMVYGNLISAWDGRQWNGAPIRTEFLPEQFRRRFGMQSHLRKPISEYAALLDGDSESEIRAPWPQELTVKYGGKGYNEWQCLAAWQLIGRNQIVGVVEAVQNRVLDFAIEIDAAAPDAGEAPPNLPPIEQERVAQVFHTVIMGGTNNIATGNTNVMQTSSAGVTAGDLDSLLAALRDGGVPAQAIEDLEQHLKTNPEPQKVAETWLGKLAISGAQGLVTTGITLAAKAISSYFGLPS
jgi:hypothetical protein